MTVNTLFMIGEHVAFIYMSRPKCCNHRRSRAKTQLISISSGNSIVSIIKDCCDSNDSNDSNAVRKLEMTSIFTSKFAPKKKKLILSVAPKTPKTEI